MVATVTSLNGHLNGQAPGPSIPRREVWLTLPGDYREFRVLVWRNFPQRLKRELTSGDTERILTAMTLIILEHNGWIDDAGEPFPPANTQAFWEEIPDELAMLIMNRILEETKTLPTFPA